MKKKVTKDPDVQDLNKRLTDLGLPEIQEQKPAKPEQKPKKTYKRKTQTEKEKIAKDANKKLQDWIKKQRNIAHEDARKEAERIEKHIQEIRDKAFSEERERSFRKFNCPELIKIFGGWFTLTYAFSLKNGQVGQDGQDYYIVSQDVSFMDVNSRPELNRIILREFKKEVYGFAIIAPASAFGEGGAIV